MAQVRTVYQHYDEMAQLLASGEIWIADTDDGGYRQAKAKGAEHRAGLSGGRLHRLV